MFKIGIHNTGIHSSIFVKYKSKINAIPEERITRLKYDKYFPSEALDIFLKDYNLSADDITDVIIAWNPSLNINQRYRASLSEWSRHPSERLFSNANIILPKIKNKQIEFTHQKFKYKNK